MRSHVWVLIQSDCYPYEKMKLEYRNFEREENVKTWEEDDHLQAKEKGFKEIKTAIALI